MHFDSLFHEKPISDEVLAQAAIGLILNENNSALHNCFKSGQLNDPFTVNSSFRVNSAEIRSVRFSNGTKEENICVAQTEGGYKVKVNDGEWRKVSVQTVKDDDRFTLKINMEGVVSNFSVVITPETLTYFDEVRKRIVKIFD